MTSGGPQAALSKKVGGSPSDEGTDTARSAARNASAMPGPSRGGRKITLSPSPASRQSRSTSAR